MSRVIETLDAIKEYDRITGGNISVTYDQIRFVGNDGSLFYIDFARPICFWRSGLPTCYLDDIQSAGCYSKQDINTV
jgi:hypothetical protein